MKRAGSAPSLTPQLYKIRAQELLFFSLPSKYECHLFTIILIYSPFKAKLFTSRILPVFADSLYHDPL